MLITESEPEPGNGKDGNTRHVTLPGLKRKKNLLRWKSSHKRNVSFLTAAY